MSTVLALDRRSAARVQDTAAQAERTPPSALQLSLAPPDTRVRALIERFNSAGPQIALVVDAQRRLLGTVTDGDIRRGFLSGAGMDTAVAAVMNARPRVVRLGEARTDLAAYMRRERIKHVPIIDFAGRPVDLVTMDSLLAPAALENWVVLMAGGKGMRLRPLTEQTPKPMLAVGGRPILETVIGRLAQAGFRTIFISVNYRAEVIKAHFGDGAALGVTIRYLEESRPLGTAGALSLLPELPPAPMLVMNGDILTTADPARLLAFHGEHEASATMAVRDYEIQIPYGVVDLRDHAICGLREKPRERYFINAGMYVLGPDAVARVRHDAALDMPQLFDTLRADGLKTLAYPVCEYWVDIGLMEDYRRANAEFATLF